MRNKSPEKKYWHTEREKTENGKKRKRGLRELKNRGKGNKGRKLYFVCFPVYEYLPWI